MKTVILAGGLGTRLSELTETLPKPMLQIGGIPVLRHIMNSYAAFDFTEFVLALGYKADLVKKYFLDCYTVGSDLSIDAEAGSIRIHQKDDQKCQIHLIDTGLRIVNSMVLF